MTTFCIALHETIQCFRSCSERKGAVSYRKGFSYYFCQMIEGSGSGSVHVTNGSGWDLGGPKTYGSYGSESTTLKSTKKSVLPKWHCENWKRLGTPSCIIILERATCSLQRFFRIWRHALMFCPAGPCCPSLLWLLFPLFICLVLSTRAAVN